VKGVPNDAQILQIVPTPLDPIQTKLANSKFGEVSYGSVLSYKQRVDTNSLDIINISDAPPFPFFPLPVQPHYHIALTRAQQRVLMACKQHLISQRKIGIQTREQCQIRSGMLCDPNLSQPNFGGLLWAKTFSSSSILPRAPRSF